MKATELRLGNYLHDSSERLCRVEIIGNSDVYGFSAPAIKGAITSLPNKPIPLTEEWLIKFGFSYMPIAHSINEPASWTKGNIKLKQTESKDIIFHGIHVKCVHQLQNLFFALTGKELTF